MSTRKNYHYDAERDVSLERSAIAEIYKLIATTGRNVIPALAHIPKIEQTEAVCLCAITHDVRNYNHVVNKTDAINQLATFLDPSTLELIENKTVELCEAAIMTDADTFRFIKPHEMNQEEYAYLAMLAITYNGMCMKYIPEQFQTEKMYDMAIADNPAALDYITEANNISSTLSLICG